MVERPKATSRTGGFQRATVACQNCRLRKVKCDAQSAPSKDGCGPCRRTGQQCLLDPLSDRRRSVSHKLVNKLQQRIEALESLNQRPAGQLSSEPGQEEAAPFPPSDPTVLMPCTPTAAQSADEADSALLGGDQGLAVVFPDEACGRDQPQPPPPAVPLSERPSHEAADRSPSFYGATSHPHVVSPQEKPYAASQDADADANAVAIDLDLDSPHLRDNLLQSFFKYQTLWVEIVDRTTFAAHKAAGASSRWHSGFLENAMLAAGTRLSTSKSVRALGPKYLERAKQEALKAMCEPTPAGLQSFLLLSEYEVTQGNDRAGWMFCGMACRMLSDLGLHEHVGVNGTSSEAHEQSNEGHLLYALLSACIVYEGVWTLYLGRPSSISRSVMDAVASRCRARRVGDSPWLNAWVGLCMSMAEISEVLNARHVSDSERASSLRALFIQTEEWYQSLPPELAYNEDRLMDMDLAGYGLHTQYCKVQILVRRELATLNNPRKRRHSQCESGRGRQTPSDGSSSDIYRYALRTARLIVTYREAFGMEKIPSIMLDNAVVAATVMTEHLSRADSIDGLQHQTSWLRQLVKSMELVYPHFPVVGRMLDYIKQICGSGPLCDMFPHANQDCIDGSTRDLVAPRQYVDDSARLGKAQDRFSASGTGLDGFLENLDWDMPLDIFSGGFGDSVLHHHTTQELFLSNTAPVIP